MVRIISPALCYSAHLFPVCSVDWTISIFSRLSNPEIRDTFLSIGMFWYSSEVASLVSGCVHMAWGLGSLYVSQQHFENYKQTNLTSITVRKSFFNYSKKFQKFQDKRLRVNEGDVSELKRAKVDGNLHETLLDRRSKMKADRYCK